MFRDSVLLRRSIMCVAIFHLIAQLSYGLPKMLSRTDVDRDVVVYYLAKQRIHNHEPLYALSSRAVPHDTRNPIYIYPPVLSSLLSFLPPMSFVTFARLWTLLLYAAFWIYSMCLAKLVQGRATITTTLVVGLIVGLFPGTQHALSLGQVDPILWALFGLALIFPKLRGAGTMAIALVKLWGVWPFVAALREGRRVWSGAAIVLVAGIGIGSLGVGSEEFFTSCWYWLTRVLPSLSQGSWDSDNWSVSFVLLRVVKLTGLWAYEGGVLPVWARTWLLITGIAGPIFTGIFLRHRGKAVQLSSVGCAAILCSPICWTSYLPVLLTFIAAFVGEKYVICESSDCLPKKMGSEEH